MQLHYFTTGGFVIHQLPCPGKAFHASAWYDVKGKLVACEAIHYRRGKRLALPVHRDGPIWRHLAAYGPRNAKTI